MKKKIIVFLIILSIIFTVNAYTLNRAKPIYKSDIKLTPSNILLDAVMIKKLNNDCHASGGNLAYQTGFADACDYILSIIGIRENRFKSRPKTTLNYLNPTNNIVIPIKANRFIVNLSIYPAEIFNENSTYFLNLNNTRKLVNLSIFRNGYIKFYLK